ncbi:hypothetical protein F4809DRAFT_640164 [Biscogniauxia mediterranea]|nr:hypothetical protein F4809DRAFT_640164 [Biscogniauxia mediterranea]
MPPLNRSLLGLSRLVLVDVAATRLSVPPKRRVTERDLSLETTDWTLHLKRTVERLRVTRICKRGPERTRTASALADWIPEYRYYSLAFGAVTTIIIISLSMTPVVSSPIISERLPPRRLPGQAAAGFSNNLIVASIAFHVRP